MHSSLVHVQIIIYSGDLQDEIFTKYQEENVQALYYVKELHQHIFQGN